MVNVANGCGGVDLPTSAAAGSFFICSSPARQSLGEQHRNDHKVVGEYGRGVSDGDIAGAKRAEI
jgi:hypothetical protein